MANRTRIHGLRRPVTRLFNPLSRRVAGFLPGFAILTHRGRRSGTAYRTPINVFRRDGAWVVVLTYGSDVDWVKNVLAAGGCGCGRDDGTSSSSIRGWSPTRTCPGCRCPFG